MEIEKLIDKIKAHIDHARVKHPVFAVDVGITRTDAFVKIFDYQAKNANTIADILHEEVYEFLEQVAWRDIPLAIEEACDVVAVLFRTIEWLEEQKEIKGGIE